MLRSPGAAPRPDGAAQETGPGPGPGPPPAGPASRRPRPPPPQPRAGGAARAGAMEAAEALQLGELAAAFAALPVFPLFDTAYFIVSVLYLKYEPGECGPAPAVRRGGPGGGSAAEGPCGGSGAGDAGPSRSRAGAEQQRRCPAFRGTNPLFSGPSAGPVRVQRSAGRFVGGSDIYV